MTEECTVFRQDRIQTSTEDLAKGGMIVCPSSLQPVRMNVPHPPQLEILTVKTSSTNSVGRMCIIAVYRRPQQHLATFLSLIGDYLANLPQIVPTIIVGDFNEDISRSNSSRLLQLMTSRGFSQLVQVPTTDSRSLLDHIYFNEKSFVDVIDTYYSDHDATYLSFQI